MRHRFSKFGIRTTSFVLYFTQRLILLIFIVLILSALSLIFYRLSKCCPKYSCPRKTSEEFYSLAWFNLPARLIIQSSLTCFIVALADIKMLFQKRANGELHINGFWEWVSPSIAIAFIV
jgi:hypothetical protein